MSQQKILHVCEPPVLSDGMSRGGNFWTFGVLLECVVDNVCILTFFELLLLKAYRYDKEKALGWLV